MLDMIVNCDSMEWQEAADNYPQGTKVKVLRDDDSGRTIILKIPKDFLIIQKLPRYLYMLQNCLD